HTHTHFNSDSANTHTHTHTHTHTLTVTVQTHTSIVNTMATMTYRGSNSSHYAFVQVWLREAKPAAVRHTHTALQIRITLRSTLQPRPTYSENALNNTGDARHRGFWTEEEEEERVK